MKLFVLLRLATSADPGSSNKTHDAVEDCLQGSAAGLIQLLNQRFQGDTNVHNNCTDDARSEAEDCAH